MLSNEKSENYWYLDPIALFQSTKIIPTPDLTPQQRANAFARLILLVTLILFLFGFGNWWLFLIFGLALSILFGLVESQRSTQTTMNPIIETPTLVEYYQCPVKRQEPGFRIRHPSNRRYGRR